MNTTTAARRLAGRLVPRVPAADLDERDPDFIRENLPGLWLMASFWHRAQVRGLERIPDGPVLLVGNHSGGSSTPDTMIFALAFSAFFGAERRFHALAHNVVLGMPGLGVLRRFGVVAASPDNARKALRAGAALLVYPGGDWEVSRPSWESGKVDFNQRKGFIDLALGEDVPIVPVVSIGGQETALFLSRGEGLASALGLDRVLRLKALPVQLGSWGLTVGDFVPRIPFPAKIAIEVMEPIRLREEFGAQADRDAVYESIVGRMQTTLDQLAAERRLPIVG